MTEGYPPRSPPERAEALERFLDRYDHVVTSGVSHTTDAYDDATTFVEEMEAEAADLTDHGSGHAEAALVTFNETNHTEYGYLHATFHVALADGAPDAWVSAQMRRVANATNGGMGPPVETGGGNE